MVVFFTNGVGDYHRSTVNGLKLAAVILPTTGKTTKIKIKYITIAWLPPSCDQAFLIQGKRDRERESFSPYLLKQKGNKDRLIAG